MKLWNWIKSVFSAKKEPAVPLFFEYLSPADGPVVAGLEHCHRLTGSAEYYRVGL